MSLEELLKDTGGSSVWRDQRKKLTRFLLGISVASAVLIGGALVLSNSKGHFKKVNPAADIDTKSLAQLMGLQRQADLLRGEVNKMRSPTAEASDPEVRPQIRHRRRFKGDGHQSGVNSQIVDFDPGEGFAALSTAKSDVYIPTGAVFLARLITPIKTSVEKTFVMAETIREFRMDMKRRIPRGSRLIGRSRLNPVLKGVVIEFETLVLPNGIETNLSGLGLSHNALPEIEGLYFSDKLETYGTALAFGFLSGFSSAAQVTQPTVFGPQPEVNLSNQVLSGLSTASFQVADSILRDVQQRAVEYVVVPAGEQIFVALTRRYDITTGGPK